MSLLFAPLSLRSLTLPNRIIIAPMCQYSVADGNVGDWHTLHLGQLAARLIKSALNRQIPMRENHAARELVIEAGRVTGLVVETPAGPRRFGARRGFVFASGGFPGSAAMREKLVPHANRHYLMAPGGEYRRRDRSGPRCRRPARHREYRQCLLDAGFGDARGGWSRNPLSTSHT